MTETANDAAPVLTPPRPADLATGPTLSPAEAALEMLLGDERQARDAVRHLAAAFGNRIADGWRDGLAEAGVGGRPAIRALGDTDEDGATIVSRAFDLFKRRAAGEERPIPLPDGWGQTSRLLAGGLWPGAYAVTALTGGGKSQFTLQVALHAAKTGAAVAYLGLELDMPGVVARLAGLELRQRWSGLYLGTDPSSVTTARATLRDLLQRLPFCLVNAPPHGFGYDQLRDVANALRDRYLDGPLMVVVDFLQLVASPEGTRREDPRERVGRAAYECRSIARDLGIVVWAVTSSARSNYGALGGKPGRDEPKVQPGRTPADWLVGMSKESGDVEHALDYMLALVKERHDPAGSPYGLAVAKIRAGLTGWAPFTFNGGWFEERSSFDQDPRKPVGDPRATGGHRDALSGCD